MAKRDDTTRRLLWLAEERGGILAGVRQEILHKIEMHLAAVATVDLIFLLECVVTTEQHHMTVLEIGADTLLKEAREQVAKAEKANRAKAKPAKKAKAGKARKGAA